MHWIWAVFAVSFFVTALLLPFYIRRARRAGMVGKDVHKFGQPLVAEMGGITVVAGCLSGILLLVGIQTFALHQDAALVTILALSTTLLIITIIGMLDDIMGWKVGLRQWQKPLLTLPAALPLMVVNAGQSVVSLPLLGQTDLGLLYPLLLIPLGIVGASNAFNMIAGFNGLEAGMGAIILAALGFTAWTVPGFQWVSIISFSAVCALLGFLLYNRYPAKVFPGDTMTYFIGALIAGIAIVGNLQKLALLLFALYFLEFFLKLRGRMRKESFGMLLPDGSLSLRDGIYGMEHVAIRLLQQTGRKATEQKTVLIILSLQLLVALLAFHFWRAM